MNESLYYYDPNHGNCLRIMNKVDKNNYIINGAYGSDEGKNGYWVAKAEKKKIFYLEGIKYNLEVNFFMKKKRTHGPILFAYMTGREIKWQDGNRWLQLYA
jgi:hypothetical protein